MCLTRLLNETVLKRFAGRFLLAAAAVFLATTIRVTDAAQPSETLLPGTTKGFVSIPDLARLEGDFNGTQLGELVNDEIMQPFVEDLKRQIREGGARRLEKLGVTFEELRAIVGGEVALAVVQPSPTGAAALALIDVSGHEREARELLDRMVANLTRQGGRRIRAATDSSVAVFELPRREGERQARQTASFLKGSLLCIGDDVRSVEDVLRATSAGRTDSLAKATAYEAAMARCDGARGENGKTPHLRWFVEPFGYAECLRIMDPPADKPNPDVLKVLRKQGFTAILGLAGQLTFDAERYELVHRMMVYAPPSRAGGRDKYTLGARILDFPNSGNLKAQRWAPRDLATYCTWNWRIPEAFAASKTLVDEWVGEPENDIFQSVLDDLRDAKDGPRVDIEKDLIGHLGPRVTLITDYQTPVGPKSERWLAAVEAANTRTVAAALEKAVKNEPGVRRHQIDGFTVWEVTEQQTAVTEELKIEVPGGSIRHADLETEELQPVVFQPGKARAKRKTRRPQKKQQQRQIQNVALTVAYDHLMVASHLDYLERMLKHAKAQVDAPANGTKAAAVEQLASAADYRRVEDEMAALGAEATAARVFSRSDEAFRINYELLRTNEMPKSQSIMGKLLNELLSDSKPGTVRKARLDGSKLPPYDAVRRYLGPAGTFIVTEDDGWFVTGFMLSKEMMR
jgi:hypothetical protein